MATVSIVIWLLGLPQQNENSYTICGRLARMRERETTVMTGRDNLETIEMSPVIIEKRLAAWGQKDTGRHT